MSSRPQLAPYPVITNGNMSGAITSIATIIDKLSIISYSYSWVGATPVGSVVVEVSNDYQKNADGTVRVAGTWNTLPLSALTDISGNSGNGFIDIEINGGYAIRTRYIFTSGTGSLQAVLSSKVA